MIDRKINEDDSDGPFEPVRSVDPDFIEFAKLLDTELITFSVKNVGNRVSDAFEKVKLPQKLHINRLEMTIRVPESIYDTNGINDGALIYLDKSVNLDEQSWTGEDNVSNVEYSFKVMDNGIVTFYIRSQYGHLFTEEEKDGVYALCRIIFNFGVGERMKGLLRKSSLTDNMTGVANIRGLMGRGRQLTARGVLTKYAAVFINLKNFRYINRSVGMPEGDKIMRIFADRIDKYLEDDEIVARLGGDNFIVLIRKERVDEFVKLFACLDIQATHHRKPINLSLSARMGIYAIKDTDSMGLIMDHVGSALSVAKNLGMGDVVWFDENLFKNEIKEKEVTFLFSEAMEKKEFVVYYQPKVKLKGRELCGSEALVRWYKNDKLVPPMEFIPSLEKDGTICDLDFFVFETVCKSIRDWLDRGIEPVCISSNFSRIHLKNDLFADRILKIMEKYDIDSKYVEIEITESASYEDFQRLEIFLAEMKKHDIDVSIDDFGTGYSSLSLLKNLDVDIIKLDRSFIMDIDSDKSQKSRNDRIVINNIIRMANELNMRVIAEGVETENQAAFLQDASCEMAQGYLFDRPISHDDFENLLLGNRKY